jgi:hypothetical protein
MVNSASSALLNRTGVVGILGLLWILQGWFRWCGRQSPPVVGLVEQEREQDHKSSYDDIER